MSNVLVSGLPPNITCSKISLSFSNILTKISVRKFWLRELSYNQGAKQASIEFLSHYEASKAKDRLNKLLFDFNGQKYPLTACVEKKHKPHSPRHKRRQSSSPSRESYEPFEGKLPSIYSGGDKRNHIERCLGRDPSPIRHSNEPSRLDLEIEMLRKQRLVIEEERRLLMETKKLELLKEYGSRAVKELAYIDQRGRGPAYEDHHETRRREIRTYKPLPSSMLKHQPYRQLPRLPLDKHTYQPTPPLSCIKNGNLTPLFFLPCKILLKSMTDRLPLGTNETEAKILWRQVRTTLRKRIAVALEGKPRMTTEEIVKLYRNLYSERTDDQMVKRFLKRLREESANEERADKKDELIEEASSDLGTSTTDLKAASEQPNTEPSELNTDDNDQDLNNECALSLHAAETESLDNGERYWSKRNDWWSDEVNRGFSE